MTSNDDIDAMMSNVRARWFGRPNGEGWQYEIICGGPGGGWHVMRFKGERRQLVRIVPTQTDAKEMVRQLLRDEERFRG